MQNRYNTYISIAKKIIESFNGEMPLATFLKNYFSQNKKHGSTDRKQIAHLCYCYYRLGNALFKDNFDTRIKTAFFLCNNSPKEYSFLFDEKWLQHWNENLEKRIKFLEENQLDFKLENIFMLANEMGIDNKISFIKNQLLQPNLYIRIRPNFELTVKEKLHKNNIAFVPITPSCLSLENGVKLDNVIILNKEIVIQDFSSQQVEKLMNIAKKDMSKPVSVWDCCAASGGKSILAKDVFGEIQLTVSDIRASIIANLKKRFEDAGIKKYQAFVSDISKPNHHKNKYNFIICDAPCTGSGTWSRTPEELYFFKKEEIDKFSNLQKKIAENAIAQLQSNGYFLYITCSVFTKENNKIVEYLIKKFNLKLIEQKYFEGFEMRADTMFAALLKKNV